MVSLVLLALLGLFSSVAPNGCQPLEPALLEHIRQTLPHYKLARTSDFDTSWASNKAPGEQTDGTPWCVSADFDGNGQSDVVLILKRQSKVVVMGFRRLGDSYVHSLAFSRTDTPYSVPLQLALFRTPPGRIMGGGFGDEPVKNVKNRNPGVSLEFFETSSVYLYWANGRWREVWTSD